jgi:hypothetical protein
MKKFLISSLLIFISANGQAQCKIASVKEGPSRLEVNDEKGFSLTYVQWDGKDVYDYSSCWLGVVQKLSGTIYVFLYDGSRNTAQKTVQFSSGNAKSIKIIGNKVKVLYDNGREELKDIN